jgi:hypothetical protein
MSRFCGSFRFRDLLDGHVHVLVVGIGGDGAHGCRGFRRSAGASGRLGGATANQTPFGPTTPLKMRVK